MKVEQGKFYRQRNGGVAGPADLGFPGTKYCWTLSGWMFTAEGMRSEGISPLDLINEVTVTDVREPTLSERLEKAIALFSHQHNDEAALALVVGVAEELRAQESNTEARRQEG